MQAACVLHVLGQGEALPAGGGAAVADSLPGLGLQQRASQLGGEVLHMEQSLLKLLQSGRGALPSATAAQGRASTGFREKPCRPKEAARPSIVARRGFDPQVQRGPPLEGL